MARNRAFKVALLVSFLFHLSMVTLFRVVIYFPREDLKFYTFKIVEQPRVRMASAGFGGELRVPSSADALAHLNGEPIKEASKWGDLPAIQLPTVEFASLKRLTMRQKALQVSGELRDRFEDQPTDSWARFGRGLESLTDALSRHFIRRPEEDKKPEPMLVGHPAAGMASYVEWMEQPWDRALIFAPPIEGLWGTDLSAHAGAVTLVFTVNSEGRVIEVLTPLEDEGGLVTTVAQALLGYRFAPLPGSEHFDQRGTFVLTNAEPTS